MDKIFEPGLALGLPLYEMDGDSPASRDAYGHAAAVSGAKWTPAGMSLDGVDDRITLGDNPAYSPAGAITVVAWVKPAVTGLNDKRVIDKGTFGSNTGYALNVSGGGFQFRLGNGAASAVASDPDAYSCGDFQMVTGVFRGGRYAEIWVNHLRKATGDFGALTEIAYGAEVLSIGAESTGGAAFNCVIGEVLVYARALDPLEIQRVYRATKWRYR